jgi:predicted metal-dependent hydrolase
LSLKRKKNHPPEEDNAYIRSRFIQAINKFNNKEFFECHEILEDIWFDIRDDSRDFYQGLLHIAVGFYHLTIKNNSKGAVFQLEKAITKLKGYKENYNGILLSKLLNETEGILGILRDKKKQYHIPKIIFE